VCGCVCVSLGVCECVWVSSVHYDIYIMLEEHTDTKSRAWMTVSVCTYIIQLNACYCVCVCVFVCVFVCMRECAKCVCVRARMGVCVSMSVHMCAYVRVCVPSCL